MENTPQSAVLADLVDQTGREMPVTRTRVRVWEMSGVERLGFTDGPDLIFKWGREPFTAEADILRYVHGQGIRVPEVFASAVQDGLLGMLMQDLGDANREATVHDAVTAAVATHETEAPDVLPVLDRAALTALPGRALTRLGELRAAGRWTDTTDLDRLLAPLVGHADRLADGADLAPFGLCHSEFHPTSVHVRDGGWWLLDWARSFIGPGLLDLASWQGTQESANPSSLRHLIWAYIRAGGAAETSRPRAGLPPEMWALGWHRLWIIAWYLEQSVVWMPDPDRDATVIPVIRRHLHEAAAFLWVPDR